MRIERSISPIPTTHHLPMTTLQTRRARQDRAMGPGFRFAQNTSDAKTKYPSILSSVRIRRLPNQFRRCCSAYTTDVGSTTHRFEACSYRRIPQSILPPSFSLNGVVYKPRMPPFSGLGSSCIPIFHGRAAFYDPMHSEGFVC